jgi:hypothetical protein
MIASVVSKYKYFYGQSSLKSMNENRIKGYPSETQEIMEKIKYFNPDSCYDFSVVDDESNDSITANVTIKSIMNTIENNKPYININRKNQSTFNLKFSDVIEKQGNKGKKIYQLKRYIKLVDLFASIMIISGYILSLIEHENYYFDNLNERVGAIKLIKDLDSVKANISKLNLSNYEVSFLKNSTLDSSLDFTDYYNLPISLQISEFCEEIRIYICILTFLSIPFIIMGRYLDFIREKLYIEKFTGNLN